MWVLTIIMVKKVLAVKSNAWSGKCLDYDSDVYNDVDGDIVVGGGGGGSISDFDDEIGDSLGDVHGGISDDDFDDGNNFESGSC